MRIIAISDSHGRSGVIDKILSAQKEADHIFFLGDNVTDIEDFPILYPEKKFHIISGNCDSFSPLPSTGLEAINGVNIFYTHGHTLGVKYSLEHLKEHALLRNCKIALYGHTHISNILYEDGLYIVNPGSCSRPRDSAPSYAVIDIENGRIFPFTVKIK